MQRHGQREAPGVVADPALREPKAVHVTTVGHLHEGDARLIARVEVGPELDIKPSLPAERHSKPGLFDIGFIIADVLHQLAKGPVQRPGPWHDGHRCVQPVQLGPACVREDDGLRSGQDADAVLGFTVSELERIIMQHWWLGGRAERGGLL